MFATWTREHARVGFRSRETHSGLARIELGEHGYRPRPGALGGRPDPKSRRLDREKARMQRVSNVLQPRRPGTIVCTPAGQ
jgi:hypothetical protein